MEKAGKHKENKCFCIYGAHFHSELLCDYLFESIDILHQDNFLPFHFEILDLKLQK